MSVVINETNFPDENFRSYVSQYYDLDGDGTLSDEEIARVTSFNGRITGIISLQGLDFFTEITTLDVYVQRVKGVDFSKLENLETVRFWSNRLTDSENAVDLDFSGNAKLTSILLGSRDSGYYFYETDYYYDIKSLILSPNLETLSLQPGHNYITDQVGTEVSVLDFTYCTKIRNVIISGFPVLSVSGLSNKQYLETLRLSTLSIAGALDYSENPRLKYLTINDCQNATSINVNGCVSLRKILIYNINLRGSFSVESFNDLEELCVFNTSLYYLNLGQKNSLRILGIATTPDKIAFGIVDISGCPILRNYTNVSPHRTTTSELTECPDHYSYYMNACTYADDASLPSYQWEPLLQWEKRTTIIDVNAPVISKNPVDVLCATGSVVNYQVTLVNLTSPDKYSSAISAVTYEWQVSVDKGSTWATCGSGSVYDFVPSRADSGNQYRCVVTNPAGSVTSEAATLTVYDSPVINSEFSISDKGDGDTVVLTSDASGDRLEYQWQKSNDSINWINIIENGTGETYSFVANASQNHTYYRYQVRNIVGEAFSNSAELIIVTTPIIITHPASATKATGQDVLFSVGVQGERVSYQWRMRSGNVANWTDIQGATADNYSFTTARTDSGNRYRCVVVNAAATVESEVATLTVYDPPTIVSRSSIPECVAENTEVSLSVTASGDNLQYQWQVSANSEAWDPIDGATYLSYSFTALRTHSGNRYRCKIYNEVGSVFCDIYDDPSHAVNGATPITVVYKPVVTPNEESLVCRTGTRPSLSVTAQGGRLTYQWQTSSDNGTNWSDVPGAEEDTYAFTTTKADSGKQYRCQVTNIAGTAYSTAITLTVLDPPVINSEFIVSDVSDGGDVLLQSDASGDELEYTWQNSLNGINWTDIAEAGTSVSYSFTANASQNRTYFRYLVSNRVGEAISNAAQLHVIAKPSVTSQPESKTVATGSVVSFSVTAQGGRLTYQWQTSSDNGTNWSDVPGAEEDAYAFTAAKSDSGKQYRCQVTNIAGTVESDPASLKVLYEPVIVTNPEFPNRVTAGDYVHCDADAHGDELQHRWYVKYAGIDQWYPIDTENSDIYTDQITYEHEPHQEDGEWVAGARFVRLAFYVTKEFFGNKYYCEFWNDAGRVSTPETNALYVLSEPTIKSVSAPDSAVRTGNPVSLTVVADGGDLSYQWQISVDNGASWENVVDGGKTSTYSFTATVSQNGYQYQCIATNVVGSATCAPISLKVQAAPSISAGPVSQSVGLDTTATFTAAISGTDLVYQWQVSSDNGATWIDIGDTDAPTYSLIAGIEKDGHMYRCRASNDLGFVVTGSALLTVLSFPEIITQPSSATVEYASNVVFLVSATGGELAYQWEYSFDNGATWTKITKNGTNTTYSFLAVDSQNGFLYHCIVGNKLGTVTSEAASLTVLGSATTEEEMPVLVFAGKYLPSQMAAMIRELPIGANLDEIAFGARAVETLHASIGRTGSTDPRYYEEIAESINELKSLIAQLQSQNPSS